VFSFLLAYTLVQPVTGWLVDRIGARRGFAIIMAWWSVAAMLHAFARGIASFSVLRFLLGAGEAGSWAASVRATSEWLPPQERGLATGIWGAGTSAGLIVSVPVAAWLTLRFGWRSAFIVVGLAGFVWIAAWLTLYRSPDQHPALDARELMHIRTAATQVSAASSGSYSDLLRSRRVLALFAARMFADPVAWFYNGWVPEYLRRSAEFSMADIGRFGWIPFVGQATGIVLGGVLSDRLCRRGSAAVEARMTVMRAGTLLMAAGALAAVPVHVVFSMSAITVAVFGFGLWAANMMSLCADAFPASQVGSVTGLSGVGAGIGGMIYTLLVGWMVDRFGYAPVFVLSGLLPLVAAALLYVMLDRHASPIG
jgi:ACS family hexuronate transporter-like MFS transporter